MPVFISYRHSDRLKALEVRNKLDRNNITCYLDVIDEESRTTDDITDVITKNIKKCTHLLAIISPNTNGSWWVPFEIGEATIFDRRICSYAFKEFAYISRSNLSLYKSFLPEYLHKWPLLLSDSDLDAFIQEYKRDSERAIFDSSRSATFDSLTKSGAESFHRNLKRIL
ncbi:toll/interleukin-1 receptor domain-containing protein [Acinetobacter baumannii]|uniref:toll/interleukin-1 receptor domain-containing protein n=1 Tax=Acinetobacter baumannii TaxID=470 RepID=UPI002940F402|nr:toll/interleukin-1 receptor domain-containing protein [Acinetobacter baumannii]MDV4328297.1 toll/interleukin-1 receptor domain-containing protein [Acinetobacter baumannii]MDV4333258.1 toll/interleukin-1 receptor domain-containing protein [Acinetobacter baumannii]MDV7570692.1 toll/interleukin-1 receptor domain-containing protein [Acinetobacter baumannii]HEM7111335.1 toll/interleukin-1 receptor domain-containing protein [Acinetobacter baumannii]